MNKISYTYIKGKNKSDDKAIVTLDDDTKVSMNHYDNIDAVLMYKDLIKQIEKEIKRLDNDHEIARKPIVKRIMQIISLIVSIPLSSFFGIGLYLGSSSPEICILISTLFGTILTTSIYSGFNKILEGEENSYNLKLKYLYNKLYFVNNKVKNLENEITHERSIKNNSIIDIKNERVINELDHDLDIYSDIGYNKLKYMKYYLKNILKDRLIKKDYSVEDTNMIYEEIKNIQENSKKLNLENK